MADPETRSIGGADQISIVFVDPAIIGNKSRSCCTVNLNHPTREDEATVIVAFEKLFLLVHRCFIGRDQFISIASKG